MAEQTGISWADGTANWWIGCTKVSPGCDHCYAERDWGEGGRRARVKWGPHGKRSYAKAGWSLIRKYQRAAAKNGGIDPELGRKRIIFVNSLSDFFDNHASVLWRDAAFDLIEVCPDVIIILLTKRIGNVPDMVPAHWMEGAWPSHVWLGATMVNQVEVDRDSAKLALIPAKQLIVSVGPMLGPVRLPDLLVWRRPWVLLEGESGKDARPMHPYWEIAVLNHCMAAGLPYQRKQWGEWKGVCAMSSDEIEACYNKVSKRNPLGLRKPKVPICVMDSDGTIHEPDSHMAYSGQGAMLMFRLGAKKAGSACFGIENQEFPQ